MNAVNMGEMIEPMSAKERKVEILIVEDSATQAEKLKYSKKIIILSYRG